MALSFSGLLFVAQVALVPVLAGCLIARAVSPRDPAVLRATRLTAFLMVCTGLVGIGAFLGGLALGWLGRLATG